MSAPKRQQKPMCGASLSLAGHTIRCLDDANAHTPSHEGAIPGTTNCVIRWSNQPGDPAWYRVFLHELRPDRPTFVLVERQALDDLVFHLEDAANHDDLPTPVAQAWRSLHASLTPGRTHPEAGGA